MPMGSVTFRPGVNTGLTPSLNEAGISESQLIRFKDGVPQTYGGWETLFGTAIGSTVRDLHPWGGPNDTKFLGIGARTSLTVYNSSAASLTDITPQTNTTNPTPNFSVSSGSNVVTIVDAGSSASTFNTVYFNTPVAVGDLLLNGAYQINTVTGSSIYTILSSVSASTTIASSGILPIFTTSSGSATVTVTLPNHNFTATPGLYQQFIATTSVGGLTVQGPYQIASVIDSTSFTIIAPTQATSASTTTMNNGLAQLVYYITLGPQPAGGGFGSGGFGSGGFGSGSATTGAAGTPITATDWTLDNWGNILLACPEDGPVYTWGSDSGFGNAEVVTEAPFFNGGIYISMPQQILVCWRSVQSSGVQHNLVVRWCDAGDFTNWTVSDQTTAGSFTIPTGSVIMGGLQAPKFGVIWTDIDAWVQSYVGGDTVFNHTRIGTGCGLVGKHAAAVIAGEVYWCGRSNLFKLGANGVAPLPCTVWDYIFQNINTSHLSKVYCAPNSAFNEIMWMFPSLNVTECDSYVKMNILSGEWDYGALSRTAWSDISILGNPIGVDAEGVVWQHEEGDATTGAPVPSFQSGWWSIADGNELAFVDFVIPDFRWGLFTGSDSAQVQITFFSANYPGDTPRVYGPFTVTEATEYITPRIRGRLMSVLVQGANSVFWRLGRIRYRYASAGRR